MDIEKILATGIPDLAPVYGGVRGRTLSSPKQYHAWKRLVEAGITQVIDLRADYASNTFPDRCKDFGMKYFHYPVVRSKDQEGLHRMAELFPELCVLIDKGNFYIACAQGLHRTDIALCLYWVFYAADKGLPPPPICGYRQDRGMDTHKIMGALYAMYTTLTRRNGREPIPQSDFTERKRVIKELGRI